MVNKNKLCERNAHMNTDDDAADDGDGDDNFDIDWWHVSATCKSILLAAMRDYGML